eukprot:scaffold312634_cov35-Attheya_sp.AAC.1
MATRLRPAPSVTNLAVPATVPDATTHTPPDPTVVLDWTLGTRTRTKRYRPSKPTSITAAVASLVSIPIIGRGLLDPFGRMELDARGSKLVIVDPETDAL